MRPDDPKLAQARKVLDGGLVSIELVALFATAIATTYAIGTEIWLMITQRSVTLADLLLMFLYLEVLAMIGQYLRTGQIQVRFPLYIAMVALARYIIIDAKAISDWRMLAVSGAILLLTLSVLALRYGHIKFPYSEPNHNKTHPPEP